MSTADESLNKARDAARDVLEDGPPNVDELAVLLLATHFAGAAEAARISVGRPADTVRAFAAELERKANAVVDQHEKEANP